MGGWVKKKDFTSKNGAWPAKHGDFFKEDIGILLATHESPIFVGVITKISPDIQHFSWLDRWTSSILIWSNQDFTKKIWDSAKRTPTGDLTGNKRYSVNSPVKRYSVNCFLSVESLYFFFHSETYYWLKRTHGICLLILIVSMWISAETSWFYVTHHAEFSSVVAVGIILVVESCWKLKVDHFGIPSGKLT